MRNLLLLFGIMICASCKQKSLPVENELKKFGSQQTLAEKEDTSFLKFDVYDEMVVLQAIYSLQGNTVGSLDPGSRNKFLVQINAKFTKNRELLDALLVRYSSYLAGLNENERNETVHRIYSWCAIFELFRSIFNLNYQKRILFEEVLYELPVAKSIFLKYIDPRIGQDWSSIDANEGVLIFYDFYKYLASLTSDKQIKIINEYLDKLNSY